jgi:hypothetical protein
LRALHSSPANFPSLNIRFKKEEYINKKEGKGKGKEEKKGKGKRGSKKKGKKEREKKRKGKERYPLAMLCPLPLNYDDLRPSRSPH